MDSGTCPWDFVASLLPELKGLRVLGIQIANLTQVGIQITSGSDNPSAVVSDRPLNEYASSFGVFPPLSHSFTFNQEPNDARN